MYSHRSDFLSNLKKRVSEKTRLEEVLCQFYLPEAVLELNSHECKNDWVSVGVSSCQGWRTRQEDAHLCNLNFGEDEHALFAIFDGHNGHEVAEYASEMLPKFLEKNYDSSDLGKSMQKAFLDFDETLLDAESNQKLFCKYISYESSKGNLNAIWASYQNSPMLALKTGTTATVALIDRTGHFHVANIGDSRGVLCLKGKPLPLSVDHKPTDRAERERIERAGMKVVNGRINHGLNLSRAFGDHFYKCNAKLPATQQAVTAFPDIDAGKHKIRAGDFMVLACDGVWNCMSNKQLCNYIRKQMKKELALSKICEKVVKKCVSPVRPISGQRGGDNVTCIIVRFDADIL